MGASFQHPVQQGITKAANANQAPPQVGASLPQLAQPKPIQLNPDEVKAFLDGFNKRK